jgi:aryl-alcohol dehydrogenase
VVIGLMLARQAVARTAGRDGLTWAILRAAVSAVAAIVREPRGAVSVEPVSVDEPRAGEVLVRVAGVGICHTDLVAMQGRAGVPFPAVFGHEGAGVVERVGPGVDGLTAGDHVVLTFDSCGACDRCRAGRPAYCADFVRLNSSGARPDGSVTLTGGGEPVHGSFCGQSSFATHALASVRNAVRVDRDLPLELLGPLGCSVQTGAGAVLNVLRPPAGSSLAVFGAGAVGLAAVMAAAACGCDPIVAIEPDGRRRALAAELGATHAVEASDDLRRIARGGIAFALEAVGAPEVVASAVRALASPGTCATVGFRGTPNPVTIDQGRLLYGRTLTGVIEGDADPQAFIPELIDMHRGGRLPFERLITTFPFAEIEEALRSAERGEVVKAVLTF